MTAPLNTSTVEFDRKDGARAELFVAMGEIAHYAKITREFVELRDDPGVLYAMMRLHDVARRAFKYRRIVVPDPGESLAAEDEGGAA
jgi:hypothetical protein